MNKYEILLQESIEMIQKHYKDKYYSSGLVPDSVEIMQRHPEIISALIKTFSKEKESRLEQELQQYLSQNSKVRSQFE